MDGWACDLSFIPPTNMEIRGHPWNYADLDEAINILNAESLSFTGSSQYYCSSDVDLLTHPINQQCYYPSDHDLQPGFGICEQTNIPAAAAAASSGGDEPSCQMMMSCSSCSTEDLGIRQGSSLCTQENQTLLLQRLPWVNAGAMEANDDQVVAYDEQQTCTWHKDNLLFNAVTMDAHQANDSPVVFPATSVPYDLDIENKRNNHVTAGNPRASSIHHEKREKQEAGAAAAGGVMAVAVKNKGGAPAKNLMAERRRRKRLNDRLCMLRSVVPTISKMDRTSILSDTIDYTKKLMHKIRSLSDELGDQTSHGHGQWPHLHLLMQQRYFCRASAIPENSPKFEAERTNNGNFRVVMKYPSNPNMLMSTVSTLDSLGLDIEHGSISCFGDFGLQVLCSEKDHSKVKNSNHHLRPDDIHLALAQSAGYLASVK